MSARTFRGRYDLARMELADVAALSAALAQIEALSRRGLVEFAVQPSKPRRSDAGTSRKPGRPAMPAQMSAVLAALDAEAWMGVAEVAAASGVVANSAGVHLRALAVAGRAERGERPIEGWSGGRRSNVVYRLAPPPTPVEG